MSLLLIILLLVVVGVLGVLYWRERALNTPPTEPDIDQAPPIRADPVSPEVDEVPVDPEALWEDDEVALPEPDPEPEIEPLVVARAPEPEIEPLVVARQADPEPEPELADEPASRFDRSVSRPDERVEEEPTYEEPTYEEPTYEEPTYEEPTYEEPTYEEPVVDEPEPTVVEPEEPAVTTAGLVQRAPKEVEAPSTRRSAMAQTSQRPTAPTSRSPEEVRAMLSNYKRGLQRGRVEAPENDSES